MTGTYRHDASDPPPETEPREAEPLTTVFMCSLMDSRKHVKPTALFEDQNPGQAVTPGLSSVGGRRPLVGAESRATVQAARSQQGSHTGETHSERLNLPKRQKEYIYSSTAHILDFYSTQMEARFVVFIPLFDRFVFS